MITLSNETSLTVELPFLEKIASEFTDREIELILCDDAAMRELNREHRGIDRPTDVLSFPLEHDLEGMPLGSIVISADQIRAKARELGHAPDQELALLFIHGLLHLLGYDHETDEGQMRAEEAKLIRRFGLPESLIVRTEDA